MNCNPFSFLSKSVSKFYGKNMDGAGKEKHRPGHGLRPFRIP